LRARDGFTKIEPMTGILLVGLGGCLGSMLRYGLSGAMQRLVPGSTYPSGTLAVNLTGCLLIGVASYLMEYRGVIGGNARHFLIVGVLGGFTTFSAFANETFYLLRGREAMLAGVNVGTQVVVGIALVWVGRVLAYWIWR
jgi:CrcB protein